MLLPAAEAANAREAVFGQAATEEAPDRPVDHAPDARAALADRLASASDPVVRAAAARALRDSTADAGVREALRGSVAHEPDPEAASESAAALASWASGASPGDLERRATVAGLLDAAPGAPEAVRLRVTAPLACSPLARDEEARIHALATSAGEADVRRFAIDLVGRRMEQDHPDVRSPANAESGPAVLIRALLSDPSPAVREAAALALGRVTLADARAAPALATALARDPDWEVRAAAARSLAPAAGADPHARVASSPPPRAIRTRTCARSPPRRSGR